MTPKQQKLSALYDEAQLKVAVISEGLSVALKGIYEMDEYTRIRGLFDTLLGPAILEMESKREAYDKEPGHARRRRVRTSAADSRAAITEKAN